MGVVYPPGRLLVASTRLAAQSFIPPTGRRKHYNRYLPITCFGSAYAFPADPLRIENPLSMLAKVVHNFDTMRT